MMKIKNHRFSRCFIVIYNYFIVIENLKNSADVCMRTFKTNIFESSGLELYGITIFYRLTRTCSRHKLDN